MKLLVTILSSASSRIVLDEVKARPWPSGTTISVLNVIDWAQLPGDALLLAAVKQSADILVKSASEELAKAGLQAHRKVLEGHPRTAIADYAKEWNADLVLVGSHAGGAIARFFLGSVAQATLHRSPCSVEIVRKSIQPATSAMKILICTDGSNFSMAAVKSVAQRPWPAGSQVRLVSVVPLVAIPGETISPDLAPDFYLPEDIIEKFEKESRLLAEQAVHRASEILAEVDVKVIENNSLPMGDARQVILDQAKEWGADLIVLGSHGLHGIDRFMVGSVSEYVAMHAHCSVEIIRDPLPNIAVP